jgi:hypothetical protein
MAGRPRRRLNRAVETAAGPLGLVTGTLGSWVTVAGMSATAQCQKPEPEPEPVGASGSYTVTA